MTGPGGLPAALVLLLTALAPVPSAGFGHHDRETPEQALNRAAALAYRKAPREIGQRRGRYSLDDWPAEIRFFVRIERDKLPIFARAGLAGRTWTVLAVAHRGELLPYVAQTQIVEFTNPLGREASGSGYWYKVRLPDAQEGWLLAQSSEHAGLRFATIVQRPKPWYFSVQALAAIQTVIMLLVVGAFVLRSRLRKTPASNVSAPGADGDSRPSSQREERSSGYDSSSDDRARRAAVDQAAVRERGEKRRRESQRTREEWSQKGEISEKHKVEIISHAQAGRPPSGLEEMLAGTVLLPFEVVTKAVTLGHGSILPEHRDQLRYWSQRIREAWDLFKDYKEEMLGRDRKETFEKLKEEQAACDSAWERLREARGEAREARERAREAKERGRQARERERELGRRRHEEWRARMEARIDRLNSVIEGGEAYIARLRAEIEDLEDKIRNAWNEQWADRAQERVEEKEEKIREAEKRNRDIEKEIEEIKRQLRG